ncbi:hypothetical protein Leryth_021221 [Lithospermum erythrorhizon]|nr:hypothetical protein Leryth_021221 [Lithospermum erythrorhizon]
MGERINLEVGQSSGLESNLPKSDFLKSGPISLNNSDNPRMSIVTIMLTENNYVIWNRAIKMALCAKEKLGFIDSRLAEPDLCDPVYDRWKLIDCMASSWILNLISPGMKSQFMFTNTAKKLWDEITSRYGVCSGPMLYQLKRGMTSLTQGVLRVFPMICLNRCSRRIKIKG